MYCTLRIVNPMYLPCIVYTMYCIDTLCVNAQIIPITISIASTCFQCEEEVWAVDSFCKQSVHAFHQHYEMINAKFLT